ncbi:MAG: LysR family transcriptional regulator [Gammaproteobacteria bacterium]|nr:MAG: LysR family transcriptional regulator [Gammaproteobacteria bacterium]TLY83295.1 MAG: LysR family transcriptional regulator [Gammaproteobacteria bacterium]TLZ08581.1 MAG: LysR family transcriptional regulator [Gammaproteobacteria bacterium]TLZ08909.1 MAG: LysR family transcriptional regulator [Gammaproteobacteria bacterium]
MRESPCLLPARLARGGVSLSAYARQGGAPPSSDETIRLPERLIEAVMNLIWTPAQLAMLAKVVDLNGFSAAARALAVPKAAVSRAVADLEKTLGVRVLERTTRRIALTSAGRLLYPHARRIGEETDAARAAIAKLREPEARPLRVVADPTYGRVLLSPLVPRFLEAFAHVPLEVALDAEQLTEGAWDVAIRTRPPADGSTRQRLLGAPPALLCATPAYLQRRGQPERPDDLRGHDLLTPDAALLPEFRLLLERGTQRAEVPLRPKLAVDDPAVLHAATAAGLGVGLLPEFLCRQGLATGRLKPVLSEWTVPPAAALYALYPAALESDPRVQQFVDFLAANIVPALALPVPVRPPPIHPSTQDFAPH